MVAVVLLKLMTIPGECVHIGEDGSVPTLTYVALIIGWLGLAVLALFLALQGLEARNAFTDYSGVGEESLSANEVNCIYEAETSAEIAACTD